MPPARYRTMLVDDHPYARRAVAAVLARTERFDLVGEAADAAAGLRLALSLHPDLVLMDIRLPGISGITATARLKAALPGCRVVMLSVSDDARDLFEAIRAAAQGSLLKNLEPRQWGEYLSQVMSGEAQISRDIATAILREFSRANPLPVLSRDALTPGALTPGALTPREEDILRQVAGGHSNREIATRLCIAEGTVKNHLRHILAKLRLRNRTALAAYATRAGLGGAPGGGGRQTSG